MGGAGKKIRVDSSINAVYAGIKHTEVSIAQIDCKESQLPMMGAKMLLERSTIDGTLFDPILGDAAQDDFYS